jgi:hypothetical protein
METLIQSVGKGGIDCEEGHGEEYQGQEGRIRMLPAPVRVLGLPVRAKP